MVDSQHDANDICHSIDSESSDETGVSEVIRTLLSTRGDDVQLLLEKLQKRLRGLQTDKSASQATREVMRRAEEALKVHVPIAGLLGIGYLKRDLEDLAFSLARPEEYKRTLSLRDEIGERAALELATLEKTLSDELLKNRLQNARIETRMKSVYSFYSKLQRKNGDLSKVYDVHAVRVIVPTISDCYHTLGIVHSLWRPVPGRTKDYIAFPKTNGYQSIHTTVYSGSSTVGIRIRTQAMDTHAKHGITAKDVPQEIGRYARRWFTEVVQTCKQLSDPHDIFTCLTGDYLTSRMCVFTTQNDSIHLPISATVLDCAYAIDPVIGDHIYMVKVNGAIATLGSALHNGDIIEITTSVTTRPVTEWLSFVKTKRAQFYIREALA